MMGGADGRPADAAGPPSELPEGLAPKLVTFCEELRSEGVAIGTSEIMDSFEALAAVPWFDRADFREALAATLAKHEFREETLIFPRWENRYREASEMPAWVAAARLELAGVVA